MRSVLLKTGKTRKPHSLLVTTILVAMLVFIVAYPLTSCGSQKNVGNTPTKVTPSPTQSVVPSSANWELVWSDEFNGAAGTPPAPTKWSPDIGGSGWGNQELEYNTNNQNAFQDGQGNLVLEARKDNPEGYQCWYGPCQYSSARISTKGIFSFTYGLIEARIKVSSGQGFWSSFWLLGANFPQVGWPACGEIDIVENIGRLPNVVISTVHGRGNFRIHGTYTLPKGNLSDGFHVFALQWDPSHLYLSMDGITYSTFSKSSFADQKAWVFDHPFNIILSNAVGGQWPGKPNSTTVFPQRMYVSYVRVYKEKTAGRDG